MKRPCEGPGCEEWFEPGDDPRKRFHSSGCRLRAHRADVRAGRVALPVRRPPEPEIGARVRSIELPGRARLGYADPPYPGKAHLYPEDQEVDHVELVAELVERAPDGWALSTGSTALRDVLAICPAGVRVASWHRQGRPYLERPYCWEPVIVCGGRRLPETVVRDTLVAHVPRRDDDWNLPGRKPPAFFAWVLDLLGALPGDALWEPFPGSGEGAPVFASRGIEYFATFRAAGETPCP